MRSFRDLLVWQKASALAVDIYRVTRAWPREEIYGLTSQVRRAAISIVSNIAEGEGRQSAAEFARFLRIAHGSLREIEAQVFIAMKLDYLTSEEFDRLDQCCVEVGKMLNGLINTVSRQVE
jgi:four helix bundle protein